jgi:hypothetical protein
MNGSDIETAIMNYFKQVSNIKAKATLVADCGGP